MEIEELWSAGLEECFENGFEHVCALYQRDEVFAEMCRDFVEIHKLSNLDHTTDVHVLECLIGLRQEIQSHFQSVQSSITPNHP